MCCTETHFRSTDINRLKEKDGKRYSTDKRAEVAILTPDKTDFKSKMVKTKTLYTYIFTEV